MRQLLSFGLVIAVAFVFNLKSAAIASSEGNWGAAIGDLFFGPLIVFFGVHTIVYFAARALTAKGRIASYSATRLNYIATAVAILGVIGAAANRV